MVTLKGPWRLLWAVSIFDGGVAPSSAFGVPSLLFCPSSTRSLFVLSMSKSTPSLSLDNHHPNFDSKDKIKDKDKYDISLLIIDHYDSFTYNLYDYFAQLLVEPPMVIAKDAYDSYEVEHWKHIDAIVLSPGPGTPHEQPPFSHQAISRNPHLPILGVCLGHQLLALHYGARVDKAPTPVHGQDHWIEVVDQKKEEDEDNDDCGGGGRKRYPANSTNTNTGSLLFQGLPSSFRVVRYHSLAVYNISSSSSSSNTDATTGDNCGLQVTAHSKGDDVVQAIQHATNPHYGVQFHPESVGTQHGMALLENFLKIVQLQKQDKRRIEMPTTISTMNKEAATSTEPLSSASTTSTTAPTSNTTSNTTDATTRPRFRVVAHPFQAAATPEQVFEHLYEQNEQQHCAHAMWLDSSSATTGRGELDIMAAPMSMDDIIEYHRHHPVCESSLNGKENGNEGKWGIDILTRLEEELFGVAKNWNDNAKMNDRSAQVNQRRRRRPASKHLAILRQFSDPLVFQEEHTLELPNEERLPFDYRGGFLGYLGYEVRYDTNRYLHRVERGRPVPTSTSTKRNASLTDTPTAAFFLARNSLVYHHPTQTWYMISLVEDNQNTDDILEWMKATKGRILRLSRNIRRQKKEEDTSIFTKWSPFVPSNDQDLLQFVPNRSKETYEKDIDQCHEWICQGESYELCLTNQLEAFLPNSRRSTWDLYKILRRRNPAPYAAFFRWKPLDRNSNSKDLTICCTSPERFMSVQRKQPHPEVPMVLQAEAKPIKGTQARVLPQNGGLSRSEAEEREDQRRARCLELSLKNRAENLMIVDLLRNDMSRVCQVGSVHVAKLMAIESFATVHQMVSTIRGTLATVNDDDKTTSSTCIDLLRAAFPGGSMTGAPKIRTMELLEELEQNVDRGPYAGGLGYLSVNGCMDMNIIIRTAVVTTDTNNQVEGQRVRIGAGGAITALSETQDEYEEMLLKARAVVQAVQDWATEPVSDEKHVLKSEGELNPSPLPFSS